MDNVTGRNPKDNGNRPLVRFLAVSDIHNSGMEGIDPADCDAMIVAGDFKRHGKSSADERWRDTVNDDPFFLWCKVNTNFPVFLVPGNHDLVADLHPDWLNWPENVKRPESKNGCDLFSFNGIGIWMSPWSLPYRKGRVLVKNEDELAEIYAEIPNHVDVVVSHDSPRLEDGEGGADIVDVVNGDHAGSYALREAVLAKKPKVVICGHHHFGSRAACKLGETTVLNVARVWGDHYWTPAFSPAYIEFGADGKVSITPATKRF